jgi:hypothetical protein
MELILAELTVVLILGSPGFATVGNVLNVPRSGAMPGIVAFGMTAVIIGGEIDLSVGAGAALAGCITAWFAGALDDSLGAGPAVVIGVCVAVAVGISIGPSEGKMRHWFNVPTFIAKRALFTALRGAREPDNRQLSDGDLSRVVRISWRRRPVWHSISSLHVPADLRRVAFLDELHQLRARRLCRRWQHGDRAPAWHRHLAGQGTDAWADQRLDCGVGHPDRFATRVRNRDDRDGDGTGRHRSGHHWRHIAVRR